MLIDYISNTGASYENTIYENLKREFPGVAFDIKRVSSRIGETYIELGEYTTIASFPANCAWVLCTRFSNNRNFTTALKAAEFVGIKMRYAGILFSINSIQKEQYAIPEGYKIIYESYNPHSGSYVFLYLKEL
jgi:hypothetical protein